MATEDLATDPVGPLADEFMERCRRGERPSVTEYTERHPELADRIRQVFSMVMLMERAGSQDGEGSTGDAIGAVEKQATPERIGGYRILREIGRGGMGVVYEAEQTALGRHVALKVLPIGAARKRERIERFQREARAAARLHHTNIVPVYEVGAAGDLCYYAMQFIHGQPLDLVLEELRSLYQDGRTSKIAPQPEPPAPNDKGAERKAVALPLFAGQGMTQTQVASPEGPAGNLDFTLRSSPELEEVRAPSPSSLTLTGPASAPAGRSGRWHYYRSVASVGIQVAEALEYAHHEGVIHRDIKPSNLLLDTAGRVWITDFGLAYQPEAQAQGDKALTQTGEIVGTIRYMPPERFRGWSDPRSDVYSLGLTLYEMLLFRPAFDAPEQVALMEMALHEEPTRLRKADRQIPRDLETIILKAIDKEPARRYPTAAELAGDLKRFLEDRPILARHTGIAERAWRWSRRHPSRVALAASVMVMLFLVVGGWLWQAQQQQLRAERVLQALDWAGQLRDQGRWSEARAAAEPLLPAAEGNVELKQRVEVFLDQMRFVERVLEVRSGKGDHVDAQAADADYVAAFREHGLDVESLTAEEAAKQIRARHDTVANELVAALDDWVLVRFQEKSDGPGWQQLVAVAQAADLDPWRGQLRELVWGKKGAGSEPALRALQTKADATTLPVQSLQLMGQFLTAKGDSEAAVSWLRAAQRRHPSDVWINYYLAGALMRLKPPRLDEAIGFYRAAVALRPELAHELAHALEEKGNRDEAIDLLQDLTSLRSNNFRHHYCLGKALKEAGRLNAALIAYNKSLTLRPNQAPIHNGRGNVLLAMGNQLAALADYERAIELQPDLAEAHYNRGRTLAELDRFDEALAAYDRAIELRRDFAEAHNNRGVALAAKGQMQLALAAYNTALKCKSDLPEAHFNRGNALRTLRRLDEALAAYNAAIALKPGYANAHVNRGNVLKELGRLDEALAAYERALHFQTDVAQTHHLRGNAFQAKGQLDEALAAYERAIALNPNLAEAHYDRGNALAAKGELLAALAAFDRAIELDPDLAFAHYNRGRVLHLRKQWIEALDSYNRFLSHDANHAGAHNNRGSVLRALGRLPEARAAFDRAIEAEPGLWEAHYNRGLTLQDQGKKNDAVIAFRHTTELNPRHAEAHHKRGRLLRELGRFLEALAAFDSALSVDPQHHAAHFGRGGALRSLRRFDEAVAAYDEAIKINPDYAEAHCSLGLVLFEDLGRFTDALGPLQRGHEIGTQRPSGWTHPSADWIRDCERLIKLDARLPAVLKGSAQPASAVETIELALLCRNYKQFHTAAGRLFDAAFTAKSELAENLNAGHRYYAACSAALAGCGKGQDAVELNESARAHWRNRARTWLRADLAAWTRHAESDKPQVMAELQRALRAWRQEKQLAGIRDAAEIAKLPDAEQKSFKQLWTEVADLLGRAERRK